MKFRLHSEPETDCYKKEKAGVNWKTMIVSAQFMLPWFLTYIVESNRESLLRLVHASGHGTGVLATDRLQAMPVLVPPLPEQRHITAVLGAFDNLIETDSTLIHRIEEGQNALFLGFWDGSTRVLLADVAKITMGQSPPGSSYNEDEVGTPFYQGTKDFGWRFPVRRVWTEAPTRLAGEGDIIVGVRAPVGCDKTTSDRFLL